MFIINHSYPQQDNETCMVLFQILIETSEKDKLTFDDLEECINIVKELSNCDYDISNDSVYKRTINFSQNITKPFADVCIKVGGDLAVKAYIDYVCLHLGSAEEEISFSLERLFMKYPEKVLIQIGDYDALLDRLIWGFLNNRYYGPKDPFINNKNQYIFNDTIQPKPILNCENYEDIFFKTNPMLKLIWDDYKDQINYILSGVKKYLCKN